MKSLRIAGVPEHFNYPWELAAREGLYQELGLKLAFQEVPGGTGAMCAALAKQEVDAALLLTEGAVLDVLRGSGNRLLKVYVSTPLEWGIHVPAGSAIEHVSDLAGRTVAISREGSGSHLIAIVDALARGFSLEHMRFHTVGSLVGARQAFARSEAEVFLWEKTMTQPLVDAGEFRRIGIRAAPWPAFLMSVRPQAYARFRELWRPLLDGVVACAWRLQRRRSAAAELAARYGLQESEVAAWLQAVRWSGSWRRPAAALNRVVDALQAQGAIAPGAVSLDAIWPGSTRP